MVSVIQFENAYPNELAVPHLELNMNQQILTKNGNLLTVRTSDNRVLITDRRVFEPDKHPRYWFAADISASGPLESIVRSRGPGDLPSRKHPDIRFTEQLRQSMQYFAAIGKTINTSRAMWQLDDPGYATNTILYKQYMNDPSNIDMEPGEHKMAAILSTPTGKAMAKLGFEPDLGQLVEYTDQAVINLIFRRTIA